MAVAITLLVLDLRVPIGGDHQSLARELGREWPNYVAYAVSFVTIGIIWINHHGAILRLREVDHAILLTNLFLLMTVVLLPFATSLMAYYLNRHQGEHLAAGVYAGAFLCMSAAFSVFNWQMLLRRPHLLRSQLAQDRRRAILGRNISGTVPYAVATAIAPISPYATLAICGIVAVFYALPVSHPELSE
jgi:uncharacterized membrane protein